MQYLSSKAQKRKHNGLQTVLLILCSVKTLVLRVCNSFQSAFQTYYIMPGMKVSFSKLEGSSQLNVISLPTGLICVLERKFCRSLKIVFPFVFRYADTCMGIQENAPLTNIHVIYTDVVNLLISNNHGGGFSIDNAYSMESFVLDFKPSFWRLFCPHC